MEITVKQSNQLKALAVLFMLLVHLFNTLDYEGLFTPLLYFGDKPSVYYFSLFGDTAIPLFSFVAGYGLYYKYTSRPEGYKRDYLNRLKKLYINYWIILLVFVVIIGKFLLHKDDFVGPWSQVLANATGLVNTYNGAWWFLLIYILLVLTSPFTFRLVQKVNPLLLLGGTVIFYLFAFYFRVYRPHIFQQPVVHWLYTQLVLYGCAFLPFIVGAMALHYKWNTWLSLHYGKYLQKPLIALAGISLMVLIRALIPNYIITPFVGIPFIFFFVQGRWPNWIYRFCDWLSPHSTNIWLLHMFYYALYFKDFIYGFKYPPVIFAVLLLCSVASSYVINAIIGLWSSPKKNNQLKGATVR